MALSSLQPFSSQAPVAASRLSLGLLQLLPHPLHHLVPLSLGGCLSLEQLLLLEPSLALHSRGVLLGFCQLPLHLSLLLLVALRQAGQLPLGRGNL